jgi:hypothetical protein
VGTDAKIGTYRDREGYLWSYWTTSRDEKTWVSADGITWWDFGWEPDHTWLEEKVPEEIQKRVQKYEWMLVDPLSWSKMGFKCVVMPPLTIEIEVPYGPWGYRVRTGTGVWVSDDGKRWYWQQGMDDSIPFSRKTLTGGNIWERVQKYGWMFSCPISRKKVVGATWIDMPNS